MQKMIIGLINKYKALARIIVFALAGLMLQACGGSEEYIAFDGGGFIFNYRIAEAYYGVSVKPMRRLAPGTVLEASLENPAGGKPFIIRKEVKAPALRYTFRTPPLNGVEKNRHYQVMVRVMSAPGGRELSRISKTISSELDQSALPARPLAIGPGYHNKPDAKAKGQPEVK